MIDIEVEHAPTEDRLREIGVRNWPIWTKEVSEFEWFYDEAETCFFLEGDVIVTPDPALGGEAVRVGKGDLVTFPAGLGCTWKVIEPVRKHYRFG